MRKRITTMAGAGLIALAFMTGCQGVEPPEPEAGGGGALLSKGPEAAKADSNWTLNDPCFPGRGTPLPASCNVDTPVKTDPGSGDVSAKTDPVIVVTPIEIEPADPTKVGDGKMEWSLNDPCFPGRSYLPPECSAL